jgi:hypothetical protein
MRGAGLMKGCENSPVREGAEASYGSEMPDAPLPNASGKPLRDLSLIAG